MPFCGHATIALGAALTMQQGAGIYQLHLNETAITVEGFVEGDSYSAALQSPLTDSTPADSAMVTEALALFGYSEPLQKFHTRNAFASGGVLEDPATGATTAAFAGYLRDLQWPHCGDTNSVQGDDMGSRSSIHAQFSDEQGSSIRVSGSVRAIANSGS